MKPSYQTVVVLLLGASLSSCLTREKTLPEVAPFAEGPWGRTIQPPPPTPPPAPVPSQVRVRIPEPEAQKEKSFSLFNRKAKSKPAPPLNSAERPEVTKISGTQAPSAAVTAAADPVVQEKEKKERSFSLFNRNKAPKPEPDPIEAVVAALTPKPEIAPQPSPIEIEKSVSFVHDVKPIFQTKCVSCHNTDTLHGRVSFESRQLAFQGGPAGPFIVPGNPEASVLFQNIVTAKTKENAMPPVGHRVTRKEKNTLYAWIMEGAEWPDGRAGKIVADVTPLE